MGVYYEVVCHDCHERFSPSLRKLREIRLNPGVAAEIGWFVADHVHHDVEICPETDKCRREYREVTMADLVAEDEDIERGAKNLAKLEGADDGE